MSPLPFISRLKSETHHYFWKNIDQEQSTLEIYFGTVNLNDCTDYPYLIKQLTGDVILKCDTEKIHLKLFHDLDYDDKNLLHFLLIVDKTVVNNFKRTLLYLTSRIINVTNNIANYRDKINHYLEYHNLYQYQRINSYQI